MGYKVESTRLAGQDLDEILNYMVKELGSPSAAVDFVDEVDSCYARLAEMPEMYEPCRDIRLKALGYRRAVIKNYVMIYKVVQSISTVFILRFFYGGRDYEQLL